MLVESHSNVGWPLAWKALRKVLCLQLNVVSSVAKPGHGAELFEDEVQRISDAIVCGALVALAINKKVVSVNADRFSTATSLRGSSVPQGESEFMKYCKAEEGVIESGALVLSAHPHEDHGGVRTQHHWEVRADFVGDLMPHCHKEILVVEGLDCFFHLCVASLVDGVFDEDISVRIQAAKSTLSTRAVHGEETRV